MNSQIKNLLTTFKLIKFILKKQTKIKDLNLIKNINDNIYFSLSYKSQMLIILYLILIRYFELNFNNLNTYQTNILNDNYYKVLKEIHYY